MRNRLPLILLISLVIWASCSTEPMTPTPMHCNGYAITTQAQPDCIAVSRGTLIQTPLNEQVQINTQNAEIAIQGTALIQVVEDSSTIVTLEGTTVIGIDQQVTTLHSGQKATFIDNQSITETSQYTNDDISTLPFDQLQRQIQIIPPTATVIRTDAPDILASGCPIPDNWTDNYTVQSGDSLTTIANSADITVSDLQTANCIDNPNSIQVGQVLSIPQNAIQPTQPNVTFTPSAVFFRADREAVTSGECTTLRWDVQNIRQLKLDDELITDRTEQSVCPTETSTYRLTVDYHDDTQSEHTITIEVNES